MTKLPKTDRRLALTTDAVVQHFLQLLDEGCPLLLVGLRVPEKPRVKEVAVSCKIRLECLPGSFQCCFVSIVPLVLGCSQKLVLATPKCLGPKQRSLGSKTAQHAKLSSLHHKVDASPINIIFCSQAHSVQVLQQPHCVSMEQQHSS